MYYQLYSDKRRNQIQYLIEKISELLIILVFTIGIVKIQNVNDI